MKIKTNISFIIQIILILLWVCDIIDRSFVNFIWVTAITWIPYTLLFILKLIEKRLRNKVKNKINKNGQGKI
jgi:hypothetical protein